MIRRSSYSLLELASLTVFLVVAGALLIALWAGLILTVAWLLP